MLRNNLVSRDASALTGSVTVSFTVLEPSVAPGADLVSNLRDTTKLNQFTQELRLGSTGAGPFQWVFGGFYSKVHRTYEQRLPTPGFDQQVGDPFLAALCRSIAPPDNTCASNAGDPNPANRVPFVSTDAAIDNGFGLVDNPYHANLPYVDKQTALFGEASYKISQFKLTAGGRWYNFHETRDFISGGVFSASDRHIGDKTSSNGFSPRGIISWEPNRDLSVNVQAAKGFRLGGVNDPLNIPLCTGSDVQTFGSFQTYKDETLWNYEAGVKYSRHGITFNAAAFYNDIRDLQVTLDAGSCSSRIVFNVPKAHAEGLEAELALHPLAGLDLSFAGSLLNSKFGSSVVDSSGAVIEGIRKGNRLPTVPKYQFAATANYEQPFSATGHWYVNASVQRIGNRFTQPSDQEDNLLLAGTNGALFFDPVTGAFGTRTVDYGILRLPAYTLVNGSLGLRWDSGLEVSAYVNNIFDQDPKLSLDRERGLRARVGYNIGQPRTIGLVVRQSFGKSVAPPPLPAAPLPPPPPATQTCADGSVIEATATCPLPPAPPPPPPPPAAPERG